MQDRYNQFEFDSEYENETRNIRYDRLLSLLEFNIQRKALISVDGQESFVFFVSKSKSKDLLKNFRACANKAVYSSQQLTLIEILARINRAFDAPKDEQNKQQLRLLTKETPNNEIYWHGFMYFLSIFVGIGVSLAVILPLGPTVSSLVLILGLVPSIFGAVCAGNAFIHAGFKSHLQIVQRNINSISFFTQEPPAEVGENLQETLSVKI